MTVSQWPADPPSTPPSAPPEHAESFAQPASHAPVAVLHHWLAVHADAIVAQLTHCPVVVSQKGRPGDAAHPAFEVHPVNTSTGGRSTVTSVGVVASGAAGLLLVQLAAASSASTSAGLALPAVFT